MGSCLSEVVKKFRQVFRGPPLSQDYPRIIPGLSQDYPMIPGLPSGELT